MMSSINSSLNQAFSYINNKKFNDAKAIFKKILLESPHQINSLFGLGIIALNEKNITEAKKFFKSVLELDEKHLEANEHLASLFIEEKNWNEAKCYLKKLTLLDKNNPEPYRRLGSVYENKKEIKKAIHCYEKAILLDPEYLECLSILGTLNFKENHIEKAKYFYQKALALDPNHIHSLINIGSIYNSEGDYVRAKNYYEKALALDPSNAVCLSNIGTLYQTQGDFVQAENYYLRALEHNSDYPECLSNLGSLYYAGNKFSEARTFCEEALKIKPDHVECLINLGNICRVESKWMDSKKYYDRALALSPKNASCLSYLALANRSLGRLKEAKQFFLKALALYDTQLSHAVNKMKFIKERELCKFNFSILQLLMGDFTHGWENYQSRKSSLDNPLHLSTKIDYWNGRDALTGKKILVINEQGFGDYIQFIRFSEHLKENGAHVTALCPTPLKGLIQSVPWVDQVTDCLNEKNDFDFQVLMTDLPRYFHVDALTIPHTVPYLFANKQKTDEILPPLKTTKPVKVGLCWFGNKIHGHDQNRSIKIETFLPLAHCQKVQFYSLVTKEDPHPSDFPNDWIIDTRPLIKDFSDTAAILEALDLIITVDTSIAHLAGAMNKPCWVLISSVPDWRWLIDRQDSPWYPSLRLFRQKVIHEWGDVMQNLLNALNAFG